MSNARATSAGAPSSGRRRHPAGRPAEVPSITGAPDSLADDQARRTRRYLVQMGVRVLCFVGAILVGDSWVRWALVVGAVVLPYSAVLFANAGRDRVSYDTSPFTAAEPAALPAPAQAADAGPASPGSAHGPHRVVEHQDDAPEIPDPQEER